MTKRRVKNLTYKHHSVDGLQGVGWLHPSLEAPFDAEVTPEQEPPREPLPMDQEFPPVEPKEEEVHEVKVVMAEHAPVATPELIKELVKRRRTEMDKE